LFNYKIHFIAQAIIRDEILAWHKRQESTSEVAGKNLPPLEGDVLVARVNKAVADIWQRIQALAALDQSESKVSQLFEN